MARKYKGRKGNYRKSLDSPYWRLVCSEVRLRDGHECTLCGAKTNLEVHHKTYFSDGLSIKGREMEHLNCLITLCATCHTMVHQNLNHFLNPKNYDRNRIS